MECAKCMLKGANSLPEDTFIESIGGDFHLKKMDDFRKMLREGNSPEDFNLLDLRNPEAYKENGLSGSANCLLNSLPQQYKTLLPDKNKEIIVYCNGGIQSIYAVMFLSLKGYKNVKSLAGGLSKYFQ